MKNSVIKFSGKNYPAEYLVSRLTARLYQDYPKMGAKEIIWVHSNMNAKLMEMFYPFFAVMELKRIINILRYKFFRGTDKKIEEIFEESLLTEELKKFFIKVDSLKKIKDELPEKVPLLKTLKLKKEYEFFGEMEDEIYSEAYRSLLNNAKNKIMENFMRRYIDHANIKQTYKVLKWNIEKSHILNGGFLGGETFTKIIEKGDKRDLYAFLDSYLDGGFSESDVGILDILLIENMLNNLSQFRFGDNYKGFILYYLWNCHYKAVTA